MSRARVELPTPTPPAYVGLLVAFEGGEGAGKSTQANALGEALRARGVEVVLTREPGGTPAAEAMRAIALDPRFVGLDPRAEALLFAAARADHVHAVVLPALLRGAVVITDRYLDSSIAYQGIARDLGRGVVEGLSLWAADGLVPDLTVVLDISPDAGLRRAGEPDRMEAESGQFHATVRKAFLGLAARAPHRYLVIDATSDRDEIAASVVARVEGCLTARAGQQ